MNVDPLLQPLADNGGPAFTHALGIGSPAIGAGSCLVAADERGAPRPGIGKSTCDSGAFETGQAKLAIITPASFALSFGPVPNGKAGLKEVILQNTGNDTISAVKLNSTNNKFAVPLNLMSLNVGQRAHFYVSYEPNGNVSDQGKLNVTGTNANSVVLVVEGNGVGTAKLNAPEETAALTTEKVQSLTAQLKMMKSLNINACQTLVSNPPAAMALTEWIRKYALARLQDNVSQIISRIRISC